MVIALKAVLGVGRGVGAQSLTFVGAPSLALTQKQSNRSIVTKENLRLPENYPEPWPYRERGYFYAAHSLVDRTRPHFHANSKLIVVEGNMSAQKSQTAREIADALGFFYYPEFKMDDILIDRYGNDLRDFYHYFPESFRIPDAKMFYEDPYSDSSAIMQYRLLHGRFDQYLNALAHIFNTGQGVILERSPYSDLVFANAMRAKNYIGPEFFKFYYYVRKRVVKNLNFYPHLVIYLDAPVKVCLDHIKKRGNPNEIEVADEKYLKVIEESYKDVLNELKRYSRVLTYDWTVPGHSDTIVEDIEKLEMDFFEWHSGDIFYHWFQMADEWGYCGWRDFVTSKEQATTDCFSHSPHVTNEVGELFQHINDMDHVENVMKTIILKNHKNHGFIRERGDPIKAVLAFRRDQNTPEPWYEYFWREKWYASMMSGSTYVDVKGRSFNPLYTHH